MQSMQRQFGKLMKRSPDDSQISVLLKDFDDADKLLTRIIDSTKAWRDAWCSILISQCRLVKEFEDLYAPIIGSSDPSVRQSAALTPQERLARTSKLRGEYEDLKNDLLDEVNAVDDRMIRPAMQAKDYLAPMKKTIKKREDKKLDFEHYQGRVDNSRKKTKRSDRENAVLAKAEIELARAKEEYNAVDEHLRQHLPQLISITFSLLPHLLAAQIEIQNTLLAHSYTMLHNYCLQEQFPSPPPPMDHVIQVWERDFLPAQREVESLSCIAHGKAVRQPMSPGERRNGNHANGFSLNHRRPSSHHQFPGKPSVSPSGSSLAPPSPVYGTKPQQSTSSSNPSPTPTPATTASPSSSTLRPLSSEQHIRPPTPEYHSASESSFDETDHSHPHSHSSSTYQMPVGFSPAAPRADYFSRDRQPTSSPSYLSPPSTTTTPTPATPGSSSTTTTTSFVKKKPPPPPPPPPRPTTGGAPTIYVTALYDFGGQGPGDLVFREGDRIRVLKKTDSTDDWWEGELRGVKGAFPANYCE